MANLTPDALVITRNESLNARHKDCGTDRKREPQQKTHRLWRTGPGKSHTIGVEPQSREVSSLYQKKINSMAINVTREKSEHIRITQSVATEKDTIITNV